MFRSLLVSACVLGALSGLSAQSVITTVVGSEWIFPGNGRPALNAPLGRVTALALDRDGRLLFADQDNNMVMRIHSDGTIQVVAGNGFATYSGDGGPAANASLYGPSGVAVDPSGDVLITDTQNNRIRRVSADGNIATIAGTGVAGFGGDNRAAVDAQLSRPTTIAIDSAGNIYFNDLANFRIRRITPAGIITTFAGNGQNVYSHQDAAAATQVGLGAVEGIAVGPDNSLYVAQITEGTIRRITPQGLIRVAGNNIPSPVGVFVQRDGQVFFTAEAAQRVGVFDNSTIRWIAGSGTAGYQDGALTNARFLGPSGLVVDSAGVIFVADRENKRIRRVASEVSTIGGDGRFQAVENGSPLASTYLNTPFGISIPNGNSLLIADTANARVRRATTGGSIFNVAGNGISWPGAVNVQANETSLLFVISAVADSNSNVYFTEYSGGVGLVGHNVKRVSPNGIVSLIAGTGQPGRGGENVPAGQSALSYPAQLAIDTLGRLFIAEEGNNRIRVIENGQIRTFAGRAFSGECPAPQENVLAGNAPLCGPRGVAADRMGNLYIADTFSGRVHKVDSQGNLTTVAGGGTRNLGSGQSAQAKEVRLLRPAALATDEDGNVFVADRGLHMAFKLSGGMLTSIAGGNRAGFAGDGASPTDALLRTPNGIAVGPRGFVYIADTNNNRVRVIHPPAEAPSFTISPNTLTFTAKSNGEAPNPQLLTVSGEVVGMRYITSVSAEDTRWLKVNNTEGVMPAVPEFSIDPSGLAPGAYNAVVRVTSPNARPAERVMNVRLTVEAPIPPRLALARASLSYALTKGDSSSSSFQVENRGGGELDFTVTATTTDGNNWLSVVVEDAPAKPDAPASVIVSLNTTGLEPETYTGTLDVTGPNGGVIQIPVTLSLADIPRPRILLSQPSLRFTGVARAGSPLPQSVAILNNGKTGLNYRVNTEYLSGGEGWLTIAGATGFTAPNSNSAPSINVSVNTAGMDPGNYAALLHITDPSGTAANSPQDIAVYFRVLPEGQNPGPDISPTGLVFVGQPGSHPGSQNVAIANVTNSTVVYNSTLNLPPGQDWLAVAPDKGALEREDQRQIVVQPNFSNLPPGVYRSKITLNVQPGGTREINVISYVVGNETSKAERGASINLDLPAVVQSPNSAQFYSNSLPMEFKVRTSPITASGCNGAPASDSKTYVRFATGQEYNLTGARQQDGGYLWTGSGGPPKGVNESKVDFTLKLNVGNCLATHKSTVPVKLTAPPTPPTNEPGEDPPPTPLRTSIEHSATYDAVPLVAPGSLVTIFGKDLAASKAEATDPRNLPRSLNGTRVTLAGSPLALLYVSEEQINAVIPYGLNPDDEQSLVVVRDSMPSVPDKLSVARTRPGLFLPNGKNTSQASVYFGTDGNGLPRLADSSNPAARGEEVLLYASGLGEVEDAVQAGTTPSNPSKVKVLPVVTIGGQDATVRSAVLSAAAAGRYEIRAVVPANASTGSQVPLVVKVGGQSSPPSTMAVK